MIRALFPSSLVALVLCVASGCSSSDTEEIVTLVNPASNALTDDPAPPASKYDESLTFTNRAGVPVNNSTARFRFDVAAFNSDAERRDAQRLYPSHGAHLAAHPGAIPSVQTIGTYTKQLDDTIYAGIERAVQDGIGSTVQPKRTILAEALDHLVAHRSADADTAMVYVAAALRLGGAAASVPGELESSVTGEIDRFLAAANVSKPIGFYTWSPELTAVWRQDRFLQRPLDPRAACALAGAIGAEPARRQRYESLVALYSRLTNPVHSSLVGQVGEASCSLDGPRSFLSTSRTAEVELFETLYPGGIPASANMMQDLVDAIRAGTIDLAPKADDGWYQHQQFALETLLVTDRSEERSKVAFTGKYKKRLQEAFETMLVQHRETHVKQTDVMLSAGPAPLPEFRLEPLATVYVRHARSYVFLEAALDAAYGPNLLDRGVAIGAGGAETETLRTRIQRARDLFFGLYLDSAFDLGMKIELDAKGDPVPTDWAKLAKSGDDWLASAATDHVANADVRVMIPIAAVDAAHTKYWAVIGVRTTLASYSHIHGDVVTPPSDPSVETRVALPTEQFLEVTSSNVPLSREEFRALCDANPTAEAIKSALEKR